MTLKYNMASNGDETVITLFEGGEIYIAHSDHPNFEAIRSGILADDPNVTDLFDVTKTVEKKFAELERLTDRVSVAYGHVYLDGDEIDNALTKQIVRHVEEGVDDWYPLARFFENVLANPQEFSREQLYNWVSAHDITITDDGLLVGYKAVMHGGHSNDETGEYDKSAFRSLTAGPDVFVNGIEQPGDRYVEQRIGDVVEMARSKVAFDPNQACSVGLHVGTSNYARGFSGDTVLEVWVNPRDVVSVPHDSNSAKIRCCRYEIIGVNEEEFTTAVRPSYGSYDELADEALGYDNEDGYCDDCGEEVGDCECEEDPLCNCNLCRKDRGEDIPEDYEW